MENFTKGMESRNKEEAWNKIEQQYQNAMINYEHKEGLEREKEFWLYKQETRNNTIEKISVKILQMKFMVPRK